LTEDYFAAESCILIDYLLLLRMKILFYIFFFLLHKHEPHTFYVPQVVPVGKTWVL